METLPTFLRNSTILLDTNFFIHAYSNRDAYAKFIKNLKDVGVAFVCVNFVKYEFIRSNTIDVVRQKEAYFKEIVDNILPYDPFIDELIIPTIEDYKENMQGLPLTDLIIAAYLKKYKGLYLLTNDHSDFPTKIFKRKHVFNIEEFGNRIYGIYTYKPLLDTVEAIVTPTISEDDIPF